MITDIDHQWGGDLKVGPTGDLAAITNSEAIQQRIIRRLLTSRGDYIWNLDYGAGLGGFLGNPSERQKIEAIVRSNVLREAAVARYPEPTVIFTKLASDPLGTNSASIKYWEKSLTEPVTLTMHFPG